MGARRGRAWRRSVALVGVVGLAAGFVVSTAAPAVATTVTDETSFRTAFTNAAETQVDLSADISLSCGGGGTAIRDSSTVLAVNGNGHTIRQTCANSGVLQQNGTGALNFTGVTITGGTTTGDGGAIKTSSAPVSVTNSTISGNTASGDGGGIRESSGDVTVTNSTISGNTASGDGGGIRESSGNVTVTNSTMSGNTASGANSEGGAIRESSGGITLIYSTLTQNTAPDGANLRGADLTLTVFGSVLAQPSGSTNCTGMTTTSNGYNFSDDTSCNLTAGTDHQNAGDPALGALANNGGSTQTRLPQSGSHLVDVIPLGSCKSGGATTITTDQRDLPRPAGSGCDIGAVEVQPSTANTTTTTTTPAAVQPAAVAAQPAFTG